MKRIAHQPRATYPDFNSGVEVYTAGDFLELETLGPLLELEPGAATTHGEHWFLFKGADAGNEESVERAVAPRVRETDAQIAAHRGD